MKALPYAAVVIFFLFGCSTAKDNKALNRVVSKEPLFKEVGRRWEKVNPSKCVDSIKYLPGKERIDTATFIFPGEDSIYTQHDTLFILRYKDRVITRTRTDTIKITTEDSRRLQLAYDDNNILRGKLSVTEQTALNQHKEAKKWHLWFFVLLGVFGVCIFLRIKRIL